MEKVRYELDPHNRLIIAGSGGKSGLSRFRKVLDGRFRTDENNDLSYHIKAPLPEGARAPHQLTLKGEWSLTDDHDLRLTLNKLGRETFGDQITLRGKILDVNENHLLFALTKTSEDGTESQYVLDLGGSWKADEKNRLSFHVKKEKGRYDILTLNGVWEVNKDHQVIYQYEKAELIRKKKRTHTLTFKGHWDINDKARISYVMSEGTDSVFDFRTSVGIFRKDYIEYELGIGATNRAKTPAEKVITLSGRWNLKKGVGLVFEVEYGNKRTRAIAFGADARLADKDLISFRLKNDMENKDIGATLKLSRRMLKGDGEAFVKLLRSNRESAVYAGAAWRW